VLLHPFASSADVWKPILPQLERYHEVLALGLPGHHKGEPFPCEKRMTVECAVDVLEAALDRCGIAQAHLVGNSLGGWFALELARRGRARSVVALAPGGGWAHGSDAHRAIVRRLHLTRTLLEYGAPFLGLVGRTAFTRQLFLRDAVAKPERLTPAQADELIEAAANCAVFERVVAAIAEQPLSAPLEPAPCPITFVWGSEDQLLPMRGNSEHWRAAVPSARWVVLHGAGHIPMYDAPEATAEAILETTYARLELDEMAAYAEQQRLVG
jgi:pimeloyl-ACP methyl ester carboxylesterase